MADGEKLYYKMNKYTFNFQEFRTMNMIKLLQKMKVSRERTLNAFDSKIFSI